MSRPVLSHQWVLLPMDDDDDEGTDLYVCKRAFLIQFPIRPNLIGMRRTTPDLQTVRHRLDAELNKLSGVKVVAGRTVMSLDGMIEITVHLDETASESSFRNTVQTFAEKHRLRHVKIRESNCTRISYE